MRKPLREAAGPTRGRRWTLWLVLLAAGTALRGVAAAVPADAETVMQWPVPEGSAPVPERPERPDAVPANEPAEVTAARLIALPLAARARLMAVQRAVQERRAAGARGVYVGEIHGEIELGIAYYTERVVAEAEEANALLLVWQMETPGGRVDAAVMMRDYILDSDVPSVVFVNRRAWSAGALISLANDLIIMADGASIGAATPIQMGQGGGAEPVEEKIVSALRGEFRATAEATGRSPEVAEAMVDADIAVGGLDMAGRLLTLTGHAAIDAGIAESEVRDFAQLTALLGVEGESIEAIEESWAETLVRLITSPVISGLLMTLGMLGIFFELMSPGFGWTGILGISCLALFFAGHLLVNLAGLEELILFVLGIILLGLEIFVIPGFGVTGVAGIAAIGTSLVLAMINFDIDLTLSPGGLSTALARVVVSLGATLVGALLLLKLLPSTRFGRRLVLAEALAGGGAIPTPAEHPVRVGDVGTAVTDLKPYGKGRFGQRSVEVVAEGGYVTRGAALRVSRVSGSRIEVRLVPAPPAPEAE